MVKQFILVLLVSWMLSVPASGAESTQKPSSNRGMTLSEARLFVLSLVNADRAKYHLRPLTLDPIASAAGQMHSDEMAKIGYLSHWDSSGRKCWQRYSNYGGRHAVSENLGKLDLPAAQHISPAHLAELEVMMMSEKPPNDGHRRNILDPSHNKLGVGISQSMNPSGILQVRLAQEFVNEYGEYAEISQTVSRYANLEISGSLYPGVKLHCIEVDWEPKPQSRTYEDLNNTGEGGYGDYVITNISSDDNSSVKTWYQRGRQHFSAKIAVERYWKPGIYYVTIEATRPQFKSPFLISTRTFMLD